MNGSTISSKGRVTVPKSIRLRLQLKTGDRLQFVVEDNGSVRLAAATRDVMTLKNILPRVGCSSESPALKRGGLCRLPAWGHQQRFWLRLHGNLRSQGVETWRVHAAFGVTRA
jgi:AbrB family looped-hinge helix DNA binding protein